MSKRLAPALGGALLVLCVTQNASAQGPVPAVPAAQSFRLGALELIALRDSEFTAANDGKIFGADQGPAAVGDVLAAAGAPKDKIQLSVDALLVKAPGHVVLLDSGFGPSAHGILLESLAKAGVAPASVTDIFITHAHGDHVGGTIGPDGKPAFPKATIRMAAKEWTYLQSQERMKDLVAAISSQVKTFEPGETPVPGITPVAIDGHTPGHRGYEIESQGKKLLDIGDMAHSSIISLAKPDWAMAFDSDKALGAKSRHATLQRLADSQELVFAPHFPFPGVGRVEKAKDGFAWKPDLPAGK